MNDHSNKIDEIINSLDGMERATPGPYFFTRLQQRLMPAKNAWDRIGNWISRPAIAFGALAMVVVLNVAALVNHRTSTDRIEDSNDEYTVASNSILDFENPSAE